MKNKNLYSLLLALCVIGFWLFDQYYAPPTLSGDVPMGRGIQAEFLPSSSTGAVVHHGHYSLSYSEAHEQAEWVAYLLEPRHLTRDDRKRPFFIEDPKVATGSADWRNYKGSGYDRGHLCPAGDRRFSKVAHDETFYTSNISPQDKAFNAGIWNRLEQQVRRWCRRHGTLIVVTGGILEAGLEQIGPEQVDVPRYFYKIVLRGQGDDMEALAFLIPGRESQRPLSDFLVPVDSLETLTGLDFFEKLPRAWQQGVESRAATSLWND